jgi:hypothetical protein
MPTQPAKSSRLRVCVEAGIETVTGEGSAVADAGMVMAPGFPRLTPSPNLDPSGMFGL